MAWDVRRSPLVLRCEPGPDRDAAGRYADAGPVPGPVTDPQMAAEVAALPGVDANGDLVNDQHDAAGGA